MTALEHSFQPLLTCGILRGSGGLRPRGQQALSSLLLDKTTLVMVKGAARRAGRAGAHDRHPLSRRARRGLLSASGAPTHRGPMQMVAVASDLPLYTGFPVCPVDLAATAAGFDAVAHWPALYAELRCMTAWLMAQERTGHTLSPTGLAHEAWLKLGAGGTGLQLADGGHLLSLSARAMRHILVNHAHVRRADKRQGDAMHVILSLADAQLAPQANPEDVQALDQVLARLTDEDLRAARVAELKVFAGLQIPEIADALGVSQPTVKRDWVFARARLAQLIG